eukprot:Lithocolla_globosa_v1_NODE_2719_length_1891_cov_16.958084.p2 type:complete len:102 gc:universal NODE_2719_length_1891_cov_16.958084:1404-1709(+)
MVLTIVAFKLALARDLPEISYLTFLDEIVLSLLGFQTIIGLRCAFVYFFYEYITYLNIIFRSVIGGIWVIGNASIFYVAKYKFHRKRVHIKKTHRSRHHAD